MKISGIICEYNPLHNGHLYHLEQVRRGGAEGIVAVMSGNFVQRGDAALLDKFTRARLAIEGGVDLVLELPVPYALAPARLRHGRRGTSDGSGECAGDLFRQRVRGHSPALTGGTGVSGLQDRLRRCHGRLSPFRLFLSGSALPDGRAALRGRTAAVLRSPNNTLAIAYLNAIEEMDSPLQPMTIPRRGAGHNSSQPAPDGTASATYIRQFFAEGGDCRRMMPSYAWHALREAKQNGHIASMEYLERLILYKLRTTDADDLHDIAEIGQGLEHRLYKAKRSASLEELLQAIRTKRYPMARLRRILLHILLDIRTADIQNYPAYGRILAFNDTGREILRDSKNKRLLPFSHSLAELAHTSPEAGRCAALESQATDIYQLARPVIGQGESDFRRKIVTSGGSHHAEEEK